MSLPVALFLSLLWAAPAALASEAAEEHAAGAASLLFPFINFLIFLFLVYRFVFPLARDFFKKRRDDMAAAVDEAEAARRQAEGILADYRGRLARLAEELREIRELFLAEAEKEKARLLTEAQEIAARVKTDADFLAEQEIRLARQELRREIVEAAEKAAEKLVRDNLQPADQKRIVGEFLSEVGAAR
ncbi:MAG TPA: ATP synthase F0 subunit B [Candidatus Binatia bacterium]